MQINQAGLKLVKSFEGFSGYPYRDIRGIFTIGWGHTKGVSAFSTPITEEQGDDLLLQDLADAEAEVNKLVCPLNENQFSALVSLVFNVGPGPLNGTLGACLREGDYDGAAAQFDRWINCNHKPVEGLARRRAAERALFLTAVEVSV